MARSDLPASRGVAHAVYKSVSGAADVLQHCGAGRQRGSAANLRSVCGRKSCCMRLASLKSLGAQ